MAISFAAFFAPIQLPHDGQSEWNRPGCDIWTMQDYAAEKYADLRAQYEAELIKETENA